MLRLAVLGTVGKEKECCVRAAIEHCHGGVDVGVPQGAVHGLSEKVGVVGSGSVSCYVDSVQRDGDVLPGLKVLCVPSHFVGGVHVDSGILSRGAEGIWYDAGVIFRMAASGVIVFGQC